jgi:hypothetical protein
MILPNQGMGPFANGSNSHTPQSVPPRDPESTVGLNAIHLPFGGHGQQQDALINYNGLQPLQPRGFVNQQHRLPHQQSGNQPHAQLNQQGLWCGQNVAQVTPGIQGLNNAPPPNTGYQPHIPQQRAYHHPQLTQLLNPMHQKVQPPVQRFFNSRWQMLPQQGLNENLPPNHNHSSVMNQSMNQPHNLTPNTINHMPVNQQVTVSSGAQSTQNVPQQQIGQPDMCLGIQYSAATSTPCSQEREVTNCLTVSSADLQQFNGQASHQGADLVDFSVCIQYNIFLNVIKNSLNRTFCGTIIASIVISLNN